MATFKSSITNSIRYWEPRRILYNLVLFGVVATYFGLHYPASKAQVSLNVILVLFVLAVLANVAYCVAYLVDIFAQQSDFNDLWVRYRWLLFVVGVLFAGVITRFFAMGLFS